MPNTTTTNAPVGPPICVEDPPSAEIKNPAITAQYSPNCGGTPEAIANAIASGSATKPTVTPASRSPGNCFQEYCRNTRKDLGAQSLNSAIVFRLHLQTKIFALVTTPHRKAWFVVA